jgi:hypothetical protein
MMNYARVQSKERKAVFFATITGKNITLCILAAKNTGVSIVEYRILSSQFTSIVVDLDNGETCISICLGESTNFSTSMRSSPKELFASSLHSLKAKRKRSLLSFGLFFDVSGLR